MSLKPNLTEIIFALGLGDQVVGVTQYCDDPPAAQKIDKIADYVHVDVEKVLFKQPTLVLGAKENSQQKQINFLRDRGVKVELYSFQTLAEILSSIQNVGSLLGHSDEARILGERIPVAIAQAKKVIRRPWKVLMVVGLNPLVVVGGKANFLHDVVKGVGLVNVAEGAGMRYPYMGIEDVMAARPDVILVLAMGSEKGKGIPFFAKYASLDAVKNGRVYEMDMNDFRPSPSLTRGIQAIGDLLGGSPP